MRFELPDQFLVDLNPWLVSLLFSRLQHQLGGDDCVHWVVLICDGLYVELCCVAEKYRQVM